MLAASPICVVFMEFVHLSVLWVIVSCGLGYVTPNSL